MSYLFCAVCRSLLLIIFQAHLSVAPGTFTHFSYGLWLFLPIRISDCSNAFAAMDVLILMLTQYAAVPLDDSTSISSSGFNSMITPAITGNKTSVSPQTSSTSDIWANFWVQTPPSGYHVATTCSLHGDPYPYLPPNYQSAYDGACGTFFREGKTADPTRTTPSACRSLCTIEAATVELLFWPTPYPAAENNMSTITSAPSPRISVGPDGFTYRWVSWKLPLSILLCDYLEPCRVSYGSPKERQS